MFKLNKDILYLLFKEFQDDEETLFSFLTVSKTWCETIIPILWRNPWKYFEKLKKLEERKLEEEELKKKSLLNIIISYLSDELRNNLRSQDVDFLSNSYRRPLFNYISFCRYLNLDNLNEIINTIDYINDETELSIIRKEIFNLFINENTRFTHLYISNQFDYQIHLISGAKQCFSKLEFLSCNTSINDKVLVGLIEICSSVKELELTIEEDNNNYDIVKLIEATKRLFNVHFIIKSISKNRESFCKILEDSLIKHANSIRYFKITNPPTTNIISSFINLNTLELDVGNVTVMTWDCLKNLSLPFLQILKARSIPTEILSSLTENTNGSLIEIKISWSYNIDSKRMLQAIYQNCPNLKYLKLPFNDDSILELENLLTNCQYLNGLHIITHNISFNWDCLFEILTKSSPTGSLFKLKFNFYEPPKLDSLKSFLDNWKGNRSMLLYTIRNIFAGDLDRNDEYFNLIEKYKTQGIVKKYNHITKLDYYYISDIFFEVPDFDIPDFDINDFVTFPYTYDI